MQTDRQLDERISRWLEADAPRQLPDLVLRATFERTRTTRQQGRWRALLGSMNMTRPLLAIGGAAAVVVIAGALALGVPRSGGDSMVGAQPPSSTPSQTSTPEPTDSADPTATAAGTDRPGTGTLAPGPFVVEAEPRITVAISGPGWTFDPGFNVLQKGQEKDNLPEAGLLLWTFGPETEFYVPGDPCRSTSTRPDASARTVDDIAAALAAQASRDASEPTDVTIGGHAGKSLILHVPDDAVPDDCEAGEFVSYGTGEDPLSRYHQGPGQIDELWIVDVDGHIVILDAMYRDDTSAALVEELRAIAASAAFETP